jgi:predicted RNA-binding Zn-ribbon protein involved in translation (DUF1610 family)
MTDFKDAVREYYKRNLIFFALFLGYVPGLLVTSMLARLLHLEKAVGVVSFVWFCSVVIAAVWRTNWPCPNCGNTFYRKWWYRQSLATKCVHCGFRPAAFRS